MANFGNGWTYDSSKWPVGAKFYLEVYFRSTDGNAATIDLFGDVHGSASGSTCTTSSTSMVRVRSSLMTLINGDMYRARTTSTGNTAIVGVKVVVTP